jgi:hypothetical protein
MINDRIDNMVERLAGPESHEKWKIRVNEPMPRDETNKAK